MVSGYTWRYSRHTHVMPRTNHSLALVSSQQPFLTAESEQTNATTHLDLDDTKHHADTNRQAAKETESVKKIKDVINNQMTHPLKCEDQEPVGENLDRPLS